MPWKPGAKWKHSKKAKGKCGRAAAHAANSVLKRTGDEGRAVRAGNAAAGKCSKKKQKKLKR